MEVLIYTIVSVKQHNLETRAVEPDNKDPTLRQWSVSVFENILNFASSPMNRTVLFFVSMLIWSFFRI